MVMPAFDRTTTSIGCACSARFLRRLARPRARLEVDEPITAVRTSAMTRRSHAAAAGATSRATAISASIGPRQCRLPAAVLRAERHHRRSRAGVRDGHPGRERPVRRRGAASPSSRPRPSATACTASAAAPRAGSAAIAQRVRSSVLDGYHRVLARPMRAWRGGPAARRQRAHQAGARDRRARPDGRSRCCVARSAAGRCCRTSRPTAWCWSATCASRARSASAR